MYVLLLAIACGGPGGKGPEVPVVNDARRVPDVNGDGLADVLIAVRDADGSGGERGHIAVWAGPADGPPALVPVDDGDPLLPSSVTFLGDVDGDGFSDVAYSEHGAGALNDPVLLMGSPAGPVTDSGLALTDPGVDSDGALVRRAGDLDGDGLDDVIVQRSWSMSVHYAEGGLAGPPDAVWQESAMPSWYTPMSGSWRGQRIGEVVPMGDVTGDGLDDVLISWLALADNDSTFVETWAYVIPGPCDGAEPWIAADEVFPALYGIHNVVVLSLGDVDGDGGIDLALTDPNPATAYSTSGWARSEESGFADDHVDAGSDLNADGFGDLVMRFDGTLDARVYTGSEEPLVYDQGPSAVFPAPAGQTAADLEAWRYGIWGGGVGDVDGDGFDDTVVGSDVDAWLWHGGPGGARSGDAGTQLFTNYMEPLGMATRAEAP